jgi:hypothetical protein
VALAGVAESCGKVASEFTKGKKTLQNLQSRKNIWTILNPQISTKLKSAPPSLEASIAWGAAA